MKLFGHPGGHEGALVLEDVVVEPWQLVGTLDDGFKVALYGVSLGRVYNSARAVGQGRWALELALDYAKQREAFGQKIADYQGVSFPLAQSASELHAAHLMGLNAAMLLDRGERAVKELSMAKSYARCRGAGEELVDQRAELLPLCGVEEAVDNGGTEAFLERCDAHTTEKYRAMPG